MLPRTVAAGRKRRISLMKLSRLSGSDLSAPRRVCNSSTNSNSPRRWSWIFKWTRFSGRSIPCRLIQAISQRSRQKHRQIRSRKNTMLSVRQCPEGHTQLLQGLYGLALQKIAESAMICWLLSASTHAVCLGKTVIETWIFSGFTAAKIRCSKSRIAWSKVAS